MQTKYISSPSRNSPSLLRKTAALISTVALAGVVLMFSMVLLVFVLIVIAFGGAYVWWKTRELRKRMRPLHPSPHGAALQRGAFAGEAFKGEVIEGEVIRMDERRAERMG